MKRIIILLGLFLYGCGPTAYEIEKNAIDAKSQELSTRNEALLAESNELSKQESLFVKDLNDIQLYAYVEAVKALNRNIALKEIARRDMEKLYDVNEYYIAVTLLEKKENLIRRQKEFISDCESFIQEVDNLRLRRHRKSEAMRDVMFLNAIQNSK